MESFLISSLSDWNQAAINLLEFASSRKIWTFEGELGAGKTTFIKSICTHLGVEDQVNSPTFALINEYFSPQLNAPVYHLDLYRLKTIDEALNIGIEDFLYGPNYCFIEWPQIISELLDDHVFRIQIKLIDESSRKILFL
ncbi:MAG: tRNA (adenosine(37)-N6)-threonylcarbamoyltransferase complex ATPase subunit type 1 TsaE [Bacteroidota bacterium]